ncbi:b(0,+)-type amino acid transporter 1 isoform X2 [Folsomia candida]|uniref:b(0,+)-type amino acid transporter 1 isoform X2 n=1 Tax=Folsomia candida TaxID=158441 RepID=UPI001604A913|nr:b(0,+)-type amino acid transporter 1 isoform X2 [Folsomia candida]
MENPAFDYGLKDTETKPKFLPPRSDNGSVQQTKPEKVNGGGDSTWMKSDMSNGNLDEKKQPDAQAPPVISDGTVRMKRQIGLAGGISLIVGTMIGSGIFVSPSGLLHKTGSVAVSLVVWFLCGVLATLSALSYCELGTVVPRSGGEHAYYMAAFAPLHRFFGELPAFLFAWLTVLLLKPSSLSISGMAFGQYALSPFLTYFEFCEDFVTTWQYDICKKMLAVCFAGAIATVNILSVNGATRVQIVFTGAKIATMIIIIVIGIYNMAHGQFGAISGDWADSSHDYGTIAVSFYSGLWAYDGWNNLCFVTEELKNPERNLPLAIMLGIPITTVLYILVNLSYLTVLDKHAMMESEAVAVDVGNDMLGNFKWVIPVLVCLSTIGSSNGSMFTAGRISYVAGRDGHMVDVMSYIHAKRLTPTIAIMFNVILALPMIFNSSINKLIDLFGFASWIIYALALVSVLVLRKTQPDARRVFKVPLIIPIVAILISIFLVIAPLVSTPTFEYLYVLAFTVLGIIVYYPFVYKKYQLPCMETFTKLIQLMTLVVPSPYVKED